MKKCKRFFEKIRKKINYSCGFVKFYSEFVFSQAKCFSFCSGAACEMLQLQRCILF